VALPGIKEHGHKEVLLCQDQDDILDTLTGLVSKGDVILTLGAGDIYQVGERLLERLEGE